MAENKVDIVLPEEIEYFVQSLRPFLLNEIGSSKWLECHEIVIKLSQQAALEASSYREEVVKEFLVLHGKLKVLVHEAYCINIWKTKVLPKLFEIEPNPPATFLIYTVLFHEGSVITLLEITLFHQSGCESLGDVALDVVDYCALSISQLIGLISSKNLDAELPNELDESILAEINRQKRDLTYKIGIRCLSILNYLVDKIDALPLSIGRRMISVHDIPCILSEVLHLKPWLRKTTKGFEKYIDEKWKVVTGDDILKVTKTEAQTWFCFRQILFNNNLMKSYEITDFRQKELAKCQGLLHDMILDQLPPLAELKHYLYTLTATRAQGQYKSHQNLLLEEVPQVKEKIINHVKSYGGFKKIAEHQTNVFHITEKDDIFAMAQRLNVAYNTDLLAELEPQEQPQESEKNENKCASCSGAAEKKCSNCMSVYYCSRECQVQNWSQHKSICLRPTKF